MEAESNPRSRTPIINGETEDLSETSVCERRPSLQTVGCHLSRVCLFRRRWQAREGEDIHKDVDSFPAAVRADCCHEEEDVDDDAFSGTLQVPAELFSSPLSLPFASGTRSRLSLSSQISAVYLCECSGYMFVRFRRRSSSMTQAAAVLLAERSGRPCSQSADSCLTSLS